MDFISLSKTAIFRGASPQEVEGMLSCLGAEQRHFPKGVMIYRTGDVVASLGILLSGRVLIENDDLWGNTTVLDSVGPGQTFAEAYACSAGEPLMVNVVTAEPADVLFLNVNRMLQVCSHACTYHSKLIQNLLSISAQKNLNLSRKIFHTASKSIRGRLLSYLSHQAIQNGSHRFSIPFNRQQLADYLNVDRSALSNELSKMQRDGLLKVDRNHFELTKTSPDAEWTGHERLKERL